jgi:hypothetical protein
MKKKVKVIELIREPAELNCFQIEEILPSGNTTILKVITYDGEAETTHIWSREVNLKRALLYATKCEEGREQKSEVIYQTPEND